MGNRQHTNYRPGALTAQSRRDKAHVRAAAPPRQNSLRIA